MSSGKILLGVLAGVAVGASLGILFAPEKGASTRKKISKKGDDYAEELGEKFNEFLDGLAQRFEKVKEETMSATANGRAKAEEIIAEADTASK